MRLKPFPFGLATGIVCGVAVMLATWWIIIFNFKGSLMARLGVFYPGYAVSFLGGILGLVYGFIDGLLWGLFVALIYNAVTGADKTTQST